MGYILNSVNGFDLIKSLDLRGESTVEAKDLIFNNSGKRQVHEDLGEHFPDGFVSILFHTFFIEAIKLIDLPILMVSSQNGNPVSVVYLQYQHIQESFHTVVPPIHIVPHEQEVRVLTHSKITGRRPQISKISNRS